MVGSFSCFSRNSVCVLMDFNLKSKLLAGNIYEQFGSLCRDVDGFVNQETVVQSVKNFYSNVVQVLPGDCEKPKFTCEDGEGDHVSNGDTSQEEESSGEYSDAMIENGEESGVEEYDKSFHVSTSVQSSEHKKMHIESSSIVASVDSIKKTEIICHSNGDGCALNISTPSSITYPDEIKDVNALPVMVSNDNYVIQTDMSNFVIGSSENTSETANTNNMETVNTNDMETVELSPEDNGRSVFPNIDCDDHVLSHRVKNFRYYKKLLKDAFSSRKRLAKQYEQLGILYGDIDLEANQHFEPSSVPSLPTIVNNATKKIQSSQEMCETEWVLL